MVSPGNCCLIPSQRQNSSCLSDLHQYRLVCSLLCIHISQVSIFFSIHVSLVFVHVSQPYSITRKIIAFTIRVFVSKLKCLSFHIFSRPCIATLLSVILLRISFSHLPSHSTKVPNTAVCNHRYLLPIHLKTPPTLCCHDLSFL